MKCQNKAKNKTRQTINWLRNILQKAVVKLKTKTIQQNQVFADWFLSVMKQLSYKISLVASLITKMWKRQREENWLTTLNNFMLNFDERHLSMSKSFRSDDLGCRFMNHYQYEPDTSTISDDTDTFDTTDQNVSSA